MSKITITPIKTRRFHLGDDLFDFLDQHVRSLAEGDILVVTSKIIALAEKNIIKKISGSKIEKHQVVKQEADYYLPASRSRYNLMLTIRHHLLAVNAGIDESNIDGDYYLLLPHDPWRSATEIWAYLKAQFGLNHLGVVISDSTTMPLRWGVFGHSLAHCGFVGLDSRVGEEDLFGRKMLMTTINLPESIAQLAVFAMGEVAEAQPLAVISGVQKVQFQSRPPTEAEIRKLYIDIEDDVYAPMLTAVNWRKGEKKSS